jgi:hypothetical protein
MSKRIKTSRHLTGKIQKHTQTELFVTKEI